MTARVAWIVALAQLAATVTHADPAADALAHLERGVAAYRTGDFAHAHSELTAAQQLAPDRPNPYRWLALTEVELGDCRSASVHVESFLARVSPADPRVTEMLAVRRRCIASSTPQVEPAPTATIQIESAPRDRPLYRRWWFWAAIGAVAVTAAGITYGLTRDGDAPPLLPPVTCDGAGCRP